MNRASALLRPAVLAAGALAGLIGAHALNYWLLVSDPIRREALLHSTGHAWLPQAESVAVAAALASVVGAVAFGWHGETRRPRGSRPMTLRLATAQSLGFLALELGERAFAGAPLHHLSPLLLAAGIGLQVVLAGGVAGALTLLSRAGARIARALRAAPDPAPRASHRISRPTGVILLRHLTLTAADPVRGPPAAVAP